MHVSCLSTTTVSQLFEPELQKVVIFTYPGLHFSFALGMPLWQSRKTLHEWKDNPVLAKSVAVCTRLYSTASQLFQPQVQKIAVFTYPRPHFCFPWRRPCDYHAICCMHERQFNACQIPRSMYLSIFNSFRVIRCLRQCVIPKIAIFITSWFPLGMPLGQSR